MLSAELHLVGRYLLGLSRRTHVATVTLISLVGLGLGVLALVVTLALLEGFQASIRRELVERGAHARVRPASGRRLAEADKLASLLQEREPGVQIVRLVQGTCLVAAGGDAVPAAVVGRSDAATAAVDEVLSARIGVGHGDTVMVISPRQRLTPMGPLPLRLRIEVEDVVVPQPGSESGTVLLPLADAQRLLWGEAVVEAIEVRDLRDPWRLGARVRRDLGGEGQKLEVEGLEQLYQPLLLALTLERVMIFVAVGLILIVAALNLLCNVAMVASEKRRDLAVLAGLGLTPSSLRRIFISLGLAIGVIGSLAGAVAGWALAVALDRSGALPLPRGVFVVASVPFRVQPATVAVVVGVALALSIGASYLPARLVARREPADGLRYE